MKQSQTQKNWNEFYGNNKTTGTRLPVLVIVFILALCAAFVWYFYNEISLKEEIPEQEEVKTINNRVAELEKTYNPTVGFAYNKNGSTMTESISRLNDIMSDINIYQEDEILEDYIEEIEGLDLSSDYTFLKETCIKKIGYMRKFIENPDDEYLEKYNEIDYIKALTEAFESANVRYELLDDGGIKWWYSPSPDFNKN